VSAGVRLLFGVHAHQPVGNFGHVIDDAVRRCYRPFLETLERHPRIRLSLHVSGWLLGYLRRHHADDVARIGSLVRAGQVEILGGGDTEPILAALADIDRHEQLRTMNARLRAAFGVTPRGGWLAERIWEATVVPALHRCGLRYVAVDDSHLRSAGIQSALDGYFTTEEGGRTLDIFPISERLRYLIPFAPPVDVVAEIERTAPGRAAIFFDDIEKFGVWPDTYEWVYGRGWLEELFSRIEGSDAIRSETFGEFHKRERSCGLVYLPSTSYKEMNEWLHGGVWRDFLLRYPEANWMHKRSAGASARFHALPRERRTSAMRGALQRTQANDSYWHGLFGGIYLPFLRASVYSNLARLEDQLDERVEPPPSSVADVDLDGRPEIGLLADTYCAYVKPTEGGRLCELTDRFFARNFADVLARREEDYYDAIRRGSDAHPPRRRFPGIASAHDRLAFKVPIGPADLETDRAPRGLFVDVWNGELVSYGDEVELAGPSVALRASAGAVTFEKRIVIDADALLVRYALVAPPGTKGLFSTQLDISMPSADGPGGRVLLDGGLIGGFGVTTARDGVRSVALEDDVLPGAIGIAVQPQCAVEVMPLVTVSRSESGFEKIMQAITLRLAWTVAVTSRAPQRFDVSWRRARARS